MQDGCTVIDSHHVERIYKDLQTSHLSCPDQSLASAIMADPVNAMVEKTETGPPASEKVADVKDVEIVAEKDFEGDYKDVPLGEGIVPDDNDEFIDPRLVNYPIPEVAKTVDLRNDPT
jgi:hypothetical protein